MRKYKFNWQLIGDIEEGRPHLGSEIGLDLYRIMQFTLRDVLEVRLGAEETDKLFFQAGKIAGVEFYDHFIHPAATFDEFISKTQKMLREKKVGVLRIEEVSEGKVILTIDEDLDCSGLPEIDYETCIYDEGFISALFERYTQQPWYAKEIDCWCTGARTCRFLVQNESGI